MDFTPVEQSFIERCRKFLADEGAWTHDQQRAFLQCLANTGLFQEPALACLVTAAEVVGSYDEILIEKLKTHHAWLNAAQDASTRRDQAGSEQ
jgi:hypothetical protein